MKHLLYKSCVKIITLIFVIGFVFAGIPAVYAAETPLVTSVDELTAALLNAKDGDTILVGDITFNPMPKGMILVTKNVTVKSGKDENAVFTNSTFALNGTRTVSDPLKVKFENIDFRGDAYGAPVDPNSPPVISSELPDIMKTMCAAIFKMNIDATYVGCTFEGYHYGYGGVFNAIYPSDDNKNALKLTLDDCSFRNNAAKYGGSIYLAGYGHNIILDARHCVFDDNAASAGGAIWAQDADVRLLDCSFTRNGYLNTGIEEPNGGALALYNCSADLDGCLLAGNASGGSGGAVFCEITPFKTLVMQNCTVIGNKAPEDEGLSVLPGKTNFDTPAAAYVYFSSLFGRQNLTESSETFGCLLVDKEVTPAEPSRENGFCLVLTSESTSQKGLNTSGTEHISLREDEYPIPKDASDRIAGGKFAYSLGRLQVGDNYKKEAVIGIEDVSGHAETVVLRYGDEIVLESPERKGHSFEGWEYPKGTAVESGMVFIGGKLPEGSVTARWHFVLSENLYVIWVPVIVIAAIGIAVFVLCRRKKKASSNAVPTAETEAEEAAALPDGWIDRVCEKPEIAELISKRETEVLRRLLEGKSRKQIASELFVTEATVKKHSASIYSKLDVHNKAELIYKLTKH